MTNPTTIARSLSEAQRAALTAIEGQLKALLKGQYSSLTLSFNDECGPNYSTVKDDEETGKPFGDWISEDERLKAIKTNSKWLLQWYPDTPVGFHAIAASSLPSLFAAILAEQEGGA